MRGTKTERIKSEVGREMKENPPKILARTEKKFGKERAQKQKIAIMLSKAGKAGARIPQRR